VLEAASGEQAVGRALRGETGLFITDLSMPESEAQKTILTLREQAPWVAVLLLVSGVRKSGFEMACCLAADAVLDCPPDREQLLTTVSRMIEPGRQVLAERWPSPA